MLVIEVIENVTKILPIEIKNILVGLENQNEITEIRLRVGKVLRIYFGKHEKEFNVIIGKTDLLKILSNISSNSIYSVQNDINKGYITIEGGNRIGIAGEVVVVEGKIKNIKELSSMNIRVAKEFIGVSNNIMDNLVVDGVIRNTVIVSPPGLGKTTLLRDIIRNLSYRGYNVSVIDERGEIAAMYGGTPTLDVGDRTDVISFVDKAFGMQMADAIKYLCKCGVAFITTMHGKTLEDITLSPMNSVIKEGYLDNVILLSNKAGIGKIDKVYTNLNIKEEVKC